MKFNLGDTIYWVESSCNYSKRVPCPMCFGKLLVTLILGDESQTEVSCGLCERGFEGPTGTAIVWEPAAWIESGVISGVSLKDGPKYEVNYRNIEESKAFKDSASAEMERGIKYAVELERSKEFFRNEFIRCSKKQIWSAGYHRAGIAKAEKDIKWHQLRLGMIKEKAKE